MAKKPKLRVIDGSGLKFVEYPRVDRPATRGAYVRISWWRRFLMRLGDFYDWLASRVWRE